MKPPLKVLLVEDNPNDVVLLTKELGKQYSLSIRHVQSEEEFRIALASSSPDIILSDYNLPNFDGLKALAIRNEIAPILPFVLVTGSINEMTAVACMKAGADDYIIKEHLHRLIPAVNGSIEKWRLIASQREIEDALRMSEERFRSIFQNSLAVMILIEPHTRRIIDVNEAAVRFYGWSRETLLSMTMDQIDTLPLIELKEHMSRAFEQQQSRFEFQHRRADKSIRDVEVFASRITFGGRTYIHPIVHDITERKRAEKALLLQTTALRAAANAIVITDPDGRILSVNPAFTILTGYEEKEVIGKKTSIFRSGAHSDDFYRGMWGTISSGKVWRNELINKKKDGSLYNEDMTITPVADKEGGVTHYIAIKQDITQQKIYQHQLFQSQKLESIGTLASGIAHDFNNILGIILAYSSMLLHAASNPEKLKSSIQAIEQAVNRGAALVKQILTFARKTEMAFTPVGIPALLKELDGMMKATFPKIIAVNISTSKDIPDIYADSIQVLQALLNLCVNARDAMPKGGTLTISAELVEKTEVAHKFVQVGSDRYVRINVSDTGSGIDPEMQKKIFDPFFTTKEIGKGTGMGLAVVSGVAQSHHGHIDLTSVVGVGTTFSLYLPVLQQQVDSVRADSAISTAMPGGNETILVVEDEEPLREAISSILERRGYSVIRARDGMEAISLFESHHLEIDLVFTDLGLPKMKGADLFWELKKMDPEVKVLLASGSLDPVLKSDLFQAGVTGFVQKPYIEEEVLRKIREVLSPA